MSEKQYRYRLIVYVSTISYEEGEVILRDGGFGSQVGSIFVGLNPEDDVPLSTALRHLHDAIIPLVRSKRIVVGTDEEIVLPGYKDSRTINK